MIERQMFDRWEDAACAIGAALLFGVSTPLTKSLLTQVTPMLMGGLLYLGSGIGLALYSLVRARSKSTEHKEAALTPIDAPWLAGAMAAGGGVAPVLLMWGLATTPASSASRSAWRSLPLAACAFRW